jgi:hypothetical protein
LSGRKCSKNSIQLTAKAVSCFLAPKSEQFENWEGLPGQKHKPMDNEELFQFAFPDDEVVNKYLALATDSRRTPPKRAHPDTDTDHKWVTPVGHGSKRSKLDNTSMPYHQLPALNTRFAENEFSQNSLQISTSTETPSIDLSQSVPAVPELHPKPKAKLQSLIAASKKVVKETSPGGESSDESEELVDLDQLERSQDDEKPMKIDQRSPAVLNITEFKTPELKWVKRSTSSGNGNESSKESFDQRKQTRIDIFLKPKNMEPARAFQEGEVIHVADDESQPEQTEENQSLENKDVDANQPANLLDPDFDTFESQVFDYISPLKHS